MGEWIELSHPKAGGSSLAGSAPASTTGLRAMVLQSIGPVRHEVRVPFHDSQVRGSAILIQTGWDQHWGTDAYWEPGPYLSDEVVFRMIRAGVRLVGVDFWEVGNVDPQKLKAVANLRNLATLPRTGFRFHAIEDRAWAELI